MNRLLVWEPQAFADWVAIEQRDPELAERILLAIERYADTRQGDVRKLAARVTCTACESARGASCSASVGAPTVSRTC